MADFPILTSPDGSTSINIGSVMIADGVDYGMAPMFSNSIGGNPFSDGGQLGYRFSGPRMFKFPIRLATVGALTPAGVSRALRNMAQNGAWVDLVLAGIATANAVRFDVIDGRVRESQDVKMWAGAGRRDAMLELDVQPYGYSPTWITLASVPSIALPGRITIPGASIIGDIPGFARIDAFGYLPSQQLGVGGTYGYDAFYYSFGNPVAAFVPAASMAPVFTAAQGAVSTLTGAADAPGSQVQRIFITPSITPYYGVQGGFYPFISANLEHVSYPGRYRVHAFARYVTPSSGGAIPIAAEFAYEFSGQSTGLATGGLLASVGQPLTLASDGAYSPIPTGFGFFPLGDITVPTSLGPFSGVGVRSVKIWGIVPSAGLPTHTLDIAGIWLQSLEGANGIITRDLQSVNAQAATYTNPYPFAIDGYQRDVRLGATPSVTPAASIALIWMASQNPIQSILDRYRGVMPQLSPSMVGMDLMFAGRHLTVAYKNEVLIDTPKVWWRFNEPSGASVVLDWSGNGVNGLASNMPLGASSLLYGEPGGATMATGFAVGTSAAIPAANAPRTLEAWFQPATFIAQHQLVAVMGASDTLTGGVFGISFIPSGISVYSNVNPSWAYGWSPRNTYHVALSYSGTHVTAYVNGQALATQTLPAALNTTARITAGNLPITAVTNAMGGVDEIAVYPSALSAARILAHYLAGRNTQGGTSPPVYHQGGYAGVSVRYQPRFAFSKEI